ncbi:MAG: hypothetical protein LBP80_08635, partial [Treponema sp.]|nr:hypothetical protein [Treponema sp.]
MNLKLKVRVRPWLLFFRFFRTFPRIFRVFLQNRALTRMFYPKTADTIFVYHFVPGRKAGGGPGPPGHLRGKG